MLGRFRLFHLLTLLLLAAGAAYARPKPDTWIELRSPHFVVISNASEKQARKTAGQLERMRAVFGRLLPRLQADSATPVTVLAVKDEKDFRTLEPQSYAGKGQMRLAGLFLGATDQNFILLRMDAGGEHPYATVYHEYTHFLTRTAQEWLPLWLNEGFAEFYGNSTIGDKDVAVGEPSEGDINLLRSNRLLPLAVLLSVDHNSSYYHQEDKGSIFYAESWALTHYLMMKDLQQKTNKVGDYLRLVSEQVDPLTAATRAFGDLDRLEVALQGYVAQSSFVALSLHGPLEVNEPEFKVKPLASTQAGAVRAQFLAYEQRGADARALLEGVLRDDPNNVLAHEVMGFLAFTDRDLKEARKWYNRAVELDSNSYLAHYYFAAIALSEGQLSPAEEDRAEKSLRMAMKLAPSFAPPYDRLAVLYGMRHRNLEEAHTLALTAVQLDPGNVSYRLNCANIFLLTERVKDAIATLQGALKVARSPEETARVQQMLQTVGEFQTAQSLQRAIDKAAREQTASAKTRRGAARQLQTERLSGPRRVLTGTIQAVQCSEPAVMDLTVHTRQGKTMLHAENYYKVQFSTLGLTLNHELKPCADMQGRRARVQFAPSSDRTSPGRLLAVELRK